MAVLLGLAAVTACSKQKDEQGRGDRESAGGREEVQGSPGSGAEEKAEDSAGRPDAIVVMLEGGTLSVDGTRVVLAADWPEARTRKIPELVDALRPHALEAEEGSASMTPVRVQARDEAPMVRVNSLVWSATSAGMAHVQFQRRHDGEWTSDENLTIAPDRSGISKETVSVLVTADAVRVGSHDGIEDVPAGGDGLRKALAGRIHQLKRASVEIAGAPDATYGDFVAAWLAIEEAGVEPAFVIPSSTSVRFE